MYLAIDPGEKRIGYAIFDAEGVPIKFSVIVGVNEFLDWLDQLQGDFVAVVCEDYRVRQGQVNHEFSRVGTAKVIGAIERWAHKRKLKLKLQPSSVLPVACKFVGYQYKKGVHVPDQISALAHGTYYIRQIKQAERARE